MINTIPFSLNPDYWPRFCQSFQRPLCICGTCWRKTYCFPLYDRLYVFSKQVVRLAAVAINLLNAAVTEDDTDIISLSVPDAGIWRAVDLTACYRVPKCKVMADNQFFLFFNRYRYRFIEYRCDYFPEPVLRMGIEKTLFPRLYRREGSKYQYSAMVAVKRSKRMVYFAHSAFVCEWTLYPRDMIISRL